VRWPTLCPASLDSRRDGKEHDATVFGSSTPVGPPPFSLVGPFFHSSVYKLGRSRNSSCEKEISVALSCIRVDNTAFIAV
jgi:hypothetical protein